MKKYFKNILLILSLSIIVFYISVKDNFNEVLTTLSQLTFVDVLLVIAAFLLVVLFETLMYQVFAKKYKPKYTFLEALTVQQTGYFGNAVTPFASGGQVFQALIYKKQDIGFDQSGHMLYIFFIINQITIIIYATFALIVGNSLFLTHYFIFFNLFLVAFTINVSIIFGMFFLSRYKRLHDFLSNTVLTFLHKIRIVKNLEKSKTSLNSTLDKFREEFRNKDLYIKIAPKLLILSMLRFLVFYSMPFIAIVVLNGSASFELFFVSLLCTAFIYNIVGLIPIPGASGGIEGMFLIMFSNSNVFPDTFKLAASATILWRVITYYLPMITGAIIFSLSTKTKVNDNKKTVEGEK